MPVSAKQHEEFRLGVASLACAVLVAISIFTLSVCTRRIGLFFHLYLSLVVADCLCFVSSYFHFRLPSQGLLLSFYAEIGASFSANLLVCASFYGQCVQKLATALLIVGWTFSVCLRPYGFGRAKRKSIEKTYQIAAISGTWLLGALLSLYVLITPVAFRVVGTSITLEMHRGTQIAMDLLVFLPTVFCTLCGWIVLLLGSVFLYSKKKLKTIVQREHLKIALLVLLNGLLSWYSFFQIGYLTGTQEGRRSMEAEQLPWILDVNTVMKHWFLLLVLLLALLERVCCPRKVNIVDSVPTASINKA
uniref:G_PROTEIN_RECEP_F1_2 domain-containing protein n=1 Tax=Steinernema glaseri TaxID=37863 RepID=A0A1I7YGQ1_9BILA